MKTILVAYDDTAPSRRALDRAAMLAEAFDSRVLVTSVARLTHSSPRSAASLAVGTGGIDAGADVDRARATLEARGITADTFAATGDPASFIASLADRENVDLVVIGTRGLGPVQRLLGQSVSQAVSRRVRCDLLIVHPGQEEVEDGDGAAG
jgi:nucleotide-binding universal stress UspA family protein